MDGFGPPTNSDPDLAPTYTPSAPPPKKIQKSCISEKTRQRFSCSFYIFCLSTIYSLFFMIFSMTLYDILSFATHAWNSVSFVFIAAEIWPYNFSSAAPANSFEYYISNFAYRKITTLSSSQGKKTASNFRVWMTLFALARRWTWKTFLRLHQKMGLVGFTVVALRLEVAPPPPKKGEGQRSNGNTVRELPFSWKCS